MVTDLVQQVELAGGPGEVVRRAAVLEESARELNARLAARLADAALDPPPPAGAADRGVSGVDPAEAFQGADGQRGTGDRPGNAIASLAEPPE